MVLAPESKIRSKGSGIVFTYIDFVVGRFMQRHMYVE